MILRVRGPSGQATLSGLDETTSVSDFLKMIEDKTGVPVGSQEVLAGFPPKPLTLPSDGAAATLASLGIQAGDSLTVREIAGIAANSGAPEADAPSLSDADTLPTGVPHDSAYSLTGMSEDEQLARAIAASLDEPVAAPLDALVAATSHAPAPSTARSSAPSPLVKGEPTFEPLSDGSAVVRRIVADDNSCLFSAVGYVIKGTRSAAGSLRSIVADAVLADPFEWNEVVLGKDPLEYATWIKDPRRWGGAIELSILSNKFRKEIAAFDIQTKRVDVYGQGSGYSERVMVVYDGLHYDALAVAKRVGAPENGDVPVLYSPSARTEEVMAAAARLVARFHEARQFTDTANFTLRCGVCKCGLKGQEEAVNHAKETGHQSFTEY